MAIDRKTVSYILGAFDALLSLIFGIMIFFLKFSEKSTVENIHGTVNNIEEFTIQVKNLPKIKQDELKAKLWKHFSQVRIGKKNYNLNITDIQFAESHKIIDCEIKIGDIKKKRLKGARAFFKKWRNEDDNRPEIKDEELADLAN